MKKRNPLAKLTLVFALLLTLGAARAQADILPGVSISFAPVGITMDQTARLNFVNVDVPNGMLINWRFIDASGFTLAQSAVICHWARSFRSISDGPGVRCHPTLILPT